MQNNEISVDNNTQPTEKDTDYTMTRLMRYLNSVKKVTYNKIVDTINTFELSDLRNQIRELSKIKDYHEIARIIRALSLEGNDINDAVNCIRSNSGYSTFKISIIIGNAGYGKTTLVKALGERFSNYKVHDCDTFGELKSDKWFINYDMMFKHMIIHDINFETDKGIIVTGMPSDFEDIVTAIFNNFINHDKYVTDDILKLNVENNKYVKETKKFVLRIEYAFLVDSNIITPRWAKAFKMRIENEKHVFIKRYIEQVSTVTSIAERTINDFINTLYCFNVIAKTFTFKYQLEAFELEVQHKTFLLDVADYHTNFNLLHDNGRANFFSNAETFNEFNLNKITNA